MSSKRTLRPKEPSACVQVLFEHRSGPVVARVWGTPKGFKWRRVEYFRYAPSPRNPGTWLRLAADREHDQKHVAVCARAVVSWLAAQS